MKILVTYSSLTGNTKKLAEGIFESLENVQKDIKSVKEVENTDEYDVVIVGYWVDKGGPNTEAAEFMKTLNNKTVGIFATLGFWADSDHAYNSLKNGEQLVAENNKILAKFICQGKLSEKIIEQFKKFPEGNPHAITPEKLRRYEIAKSHPSKADIAMAGELFNERLKATCLAQE